MFDFPHRNLGLFWSSWKMYSNPPPYYRELVAFGIREHGAMVPLSMNDVFSMPHEFIERGGGIGIQDTIMSSYSEAGRRRVLEKFCTFILSRTDFPSSKVSLVFLTDAEDLNSRVEYLPTQCTRQ